MIKDRHEGYVGWDEYERDQEQRALNNYGRAGGVKSGRGGKALLSGIIDLRALRRAAECRLYRQFAKPARVSLPNAEPHDEVTQMHDLRRPTGKRRGWARVVAGS